ncbi:MAG: DoxX family protein [Ardenticatenaceae bacterium]|nr:DoxX family protein [Ardenticatenaceae bacterium]HBY94612.1 DoxX family protein [Chloroflexota bacterium]
MSADLGLLLLRLTVGLLIAGHGAQKLFGWFGGHGLAGTAGWLGSMGLRPAALWAFMAAISEFGGGVLLALGLLNPLGSLGVMAAMLMAISMVHWRNGVWAAQAGIEFPLTNAVVALTLALAGPGAYSLDAALNLALPEPATLIVGVILVSLGIISALLSRPRQRVTTGAAGRAG